MPSRLAKSINWPLIAASVLLCGLWLSGPGALPAHPSATDAPVRPSATADAAFEPRVPRAVPPVGWRRTTRGWERMPLTPPPRPSINDQIARQRTIESQWPIHGLLERMRHVHPISLAAGEVAIACLIALAARPPSAPRWTVDVARTGRAGS